ncbi:MULTISPECIES: flavin reductase family protein [Alphaproteobacteria]|uniref:FMN reductase (NADH) RutF n=2 Tax=Alphaproteobacteria TaxID=28211 RepID=A0A512HPK0_9HYPH|nr:MULTISPECIES: flavin reductase family protein [Alphaproteobacteria]GEO87382.1 FMN reductase (NADH) RutF [Ciceribacter naphthalenivorans]GLR23103.1 FMN reductase (NADH) RutF [Ciceribacter naphthalenivorans]GLT05959.1 FMN reductase (NADH) RutF [Sphingomonas psychrolutea]
MPDVIGRPLAADLPNIDRIAAFKAGMGRLAAGVCVITSAHEDAYFGYLATAVTSLSTEPPSLLICTNKATSAHDPISRSGTFCVNLLAVEHREIAKRFSDSNLRESRFASGSWKAGITGAPALETALASFECEVVRQVPFHSHTIFIGAVCNVILAETAIEPLVYLDRAYRNIAVS